MKRASIENELAEKYIKQLVNPNQKKTYKAPTLLIYGHIGHLTQGSRSGTTEGNGKKRSNFGP